MKKIILKIVCGIIVLLVVVLAAGKIWFWAPAAGYYGASQAAFAIPGLGEGFVPQGLEYHWEDDLMFFTGYMKDHSASPVYVTDAETGAVKARVELVLSDDTLCTSHNGGLAEYNGRLYVCGEPAVLHVFSVQDVLAVEGRGQVYEIATVPLTAADDALSPAFVTALPEGLFVGEFYIEKDYETPLEHRIGQSNSLAVLLPYDDSQAGVSSVPSRAYSLPDRSQGACEDEDGLLYVSQSWGASPSRIDVFAPAAAQQDAHVLGVDVPLFVLNDACRVGSGVIAPMSEELVLRGGRLYINCESASQKYLFGLLNGAQNIFATDVAFFRGK